MSNKTNTQRNLLLDATCGYPFAHYVEALADNIYANGDNTNVELNVLRLAVYDAILNVLKEDSLSIESLQQQIAEWKTIKTIEDIPKLIKEVDPATFTKNDLKNVKRTVKELDEVITSIVNNMNKLVDKCVMLANKHEKVMENTEHPEE